MAVRGKHILLGVCGSIAAYKTAHLIRLLTKNGASVQVIMTPGARHFITPLTLSTLSANPVLSDYFDPSTGSWNNHVDLALGADALVIAPASANTIAKFANGLCDNLLSAIYLSARSPVFVAPAMDVDMWVHPATQCNVSKLKAAGDYVIPPGNGELASGLQGEGRLAEPEEILQFLSDHFSAEKPLTGKTALVTAGPTREAIDPVRYIGNHSSGKMGYALAAELKRLGASVTLVSGPTGLTAPHGVKLVPVTTAAEMLEQCTSRFADTDITVMSAAIADYTPLEVSPSKIKKTGDTLTISLKKTTDILASLGNQKRGDQILVGFALETDNEIANATDKLRRKKVDFIVLNSMRDIGAGFASDNNKVTIIHKMGKTETFELKSKNDVARDIGARIVALVGSQN